MECPLLQDQNNLQVKPLLLLFPLLFLLQELQEPLVPAHQKLLLQKPLLQEPQVLQVLLQKLHPQGFLLTEFLQELILPEALLE